MIGLYGGAFDPPHRGHVELARSAKEQLGLDRLIVLVATDPGHKRVSTPAELRLRLARAAFPDDEVLLDPHSRTVETLRAHPEWQDAVFLVGADELQVFESWVEPGEVLRRVRLGVAMRPGYPREGLEAVRERLAEPERVLFFELEPTPVASRSLRERLSGGVDVGDEVPLAVARILAAERVYDASRGYTPGV